MLSFKGQVKDGTIGKMLGIYILSIISLNVNSDGFLLSE